MLGVCVCEYVRCGGNVRQREGEERREKGREGEGREEKRTFPVESVPTGPPNKVVFKILCSFIQGTPS